MAVAFEMRFRGATLEQYDQVIELMGFSQGGSVDTPGAIFHWVTGTDDGILVVDVWETDEDFQRFAEEQIVPHARQAGFPGEPEITRHEVHNMLSSRIAAGMR